MHRRAAGFTIIEVLISLAVLAVGVSVIMTVITSSIRSNGDSRNRTSSVVAADSWLDRYRDGKEPLGSNGSGCSGTTVVTCSYPKGHNYAGDGDVPSHLADSAALNAQFSTYNITIVNTLIGTGTNNKLWQVQVTAVPPQGGQSVISTRMLQ